VTAIILDPAWIAEDGTEPVLPMARYFIRPTTTYGGTSGQVLNIYGPPIIITGDPVTINLTPSATAGMYEFQLRFRDVEGNDIIRTQYSLVPDTGTFHLEELTAQLAP
jgi:hypothetical protein